MSELMRPQVHDISTFDNLKSGFRSFSIEEPKVETVVANPSSIQIDVGSIQVSAEPQVGRMVQPNQVKITIDGVEQTKIRKLVLRIAIDEVVTAEIERLV